MQSCSTVHQGIQGRSIRRYHVAECCKCGRMLTGSVARQAVEPQLDLLVGRQRPLYKAVHYGRS